MLRHAAATYPPMHRTGGEGILSFPSRVRLALAVCSFVVTLALPHPEGIWYFGRRPQWLIAIDVLGLEMGPSTDPALLGWIPLVVLKMLLV